MHALSASSTQLFSAIHAGEIVTIALPDARDRIGKSAIAWGRAEEIGSPAYWASQAWMWELDAPDHFRLGCSLRDEVLACMLGGYGIPAEVGLAAYARLKNKTNELLRDEESLYILLSQPLEVAARKVRYRFAKQKAKRVAAAMCKIGTVDESLPDRELRDALTELPGIGPKTASWIVRNWRASDDVAILDIHILRIGRNLGFFPENLSVERHYNALEEAFLTFARALGVRASILDSVMWMTIRRLPARILPTRRGRGMNHRQQPNTPNQGRQAAFL